MGAAERQLSASADELVEKIGMSFITISTIVNLASLTFLFWFQSKPIVAMGQPQLLAAMCVGSLAYVGGNAFHLSAVMDERVEGRKSDVYCKLSFTFLFLGAFAVDLILFLKLYRVYKVMRFRRGQTFLPRHIIVPFVGAFFVPAVLGILIATSEACTQETVQSTLFIIIVYSLRVALMVFALILRNVTESVGDTRRIFYYLVFVIMSGSFFWVSYYCKLGEKIRKAMTNSYAGEIIDFIIGSLPLFLQSVAPAIFFVFPRMHLVWYERLHGHLPDHVQVYGAGNVHVSIYSGTSPGAANAIANANANANVGTTTTTATVSRAEASAENPAATTKTKEIVGGTGNENNTVVNIEDCEDGEDGGSSWQTRNEDDDDDDDDSAAAAAAVANV